jgi:hypothetical protein
MAMAILTFLKAQSVKEKGVQQAASVMPVGRDKTYWHEAA